ncbi:mitochondrial chaperone bcs1 [Colletotrichum tofieldiae]|nr:mitochondrial chaperone bcs1 [Colletotrichum tofieldiae]
MNDTHLAELFEELPRDSMLLFEDIDASGLKNRETSPAKDYCGVTLSGLLNLIDGPGAPEGRILVMTTNKPDKLDEALVRPGRVDKTFHFPLADKDCANLLFRSLMSGEKEDIEILAQEFAEKIPPNKLSPADLQNYLKGSAVWRHGLRKGGARTAQTPLVSQAIVGSLVLNR